MKMTMRKYAVWLGSVFPFAAVISVLALGLSGQATWGDDEKKFSEEAKAASETKKQEIVHELKTLKAHAWAGKYHYGDGLGVNVDLSLAPGSGFVFTWHGCLGLYDLNYGGVEEADGRVRLIFKYPNDREGFQGVAPEIIPVVWGERHYLIPADGVVEFANAINAGFATSRTVSRRFRLRNGDEHTAVHGQQNIHAAYSAYLITQPIKAEITSIKERRIENSARIITVVLNAGGAQGVRKGMEFYVYSPSNIFESARVTRVDSSQSEARIIQYEADEKYGRPATNWKMSTFVGRD